MQNLSAPTGTKMLPADKARCPGIGASEPPPRPVAPQCQNCLRRTTPPHDRQAWMLPDDDEICKSKIKE